MALKHVILAFLVNRQASGYAMHKAAFKPLRPKLPQIYRAISELYGDGLIRRKRLHHGTKPTENIYEVTEAGYKILDQWLNSPPKVPSIREPTMLKIWFSGTSIRLFKKEIATETIKEYIEKRQDELNYYETEAANIIKRSVKNLDPTEKLYRELVIDYFAMRAKTDLQWAKLALRKIKRLP